MNSAIKWIIGGITAVALFPKFSRAANITNNVLVNIGGINANVRFTPLPVVNLNITAAIQNFSGISVSIKNFWIRIQYRDANNNWKDVGNSPRIIPEIKLIANQNISKKVALSLPATNLFSKGIKGATPFRAVSVYDFAGYPVTSVIKEFTLNDYIDFGQLGGVGTTPISQSFIGGL